jgi:hypothetical protein
MLLAVSHGSKPPWCAWQADLMADMRWHDALLALEWRITVAVASWCGRVTFLTSMSININHTLLLQ